MNDKTEQEARKLLTPIIDSIPTSDSELLILEIAKALDEAYSRGYNHAELRFRELKFK